MKNINRRNISQIQRNFYILLEKIKPRFHISLNTISVYCSIILAWEIEPLIWMCNRWDLGNAASECMRDHSCAQGVLLFLRHHFIFKSIPLCFTQSFKQRSGSQCFHLFGKIEVWSYSFRWSLLYPVCLVWFCQCNTANLHCFKWSAWNLW